MCVKRLFKPFKRPECAYQTGSSPYADESPTSPGPSGTRSPSASPVAVVITPSPVRSPSPVVVRPSPRVKSARSPSYAVSPEVIVEPASPLALEVATVAASEPRLLPLVTDVAAVESANELSRARSEVQVAKSPSAKAYLEAADASTAVSVDLAIQVDLMEQVLRELQALVNRIEPSASSPVAVEAAKEAINRPSAGSAQRALVATQKALLDAKALPRPKIFDFQKIGRAVMDLGLKKIAATTTLALRASTTSMVMSAQARDVSEGHGLVGLQAAKKASARANQLAVQLRHVVGQDKPQKILEQETYWAELENDVTRRRATTVSLLAPQQACVNARGQRQTRASHAQDAAMTPEAALQFAARATQMGVKSADVGVLARYFHYCYKASLELHEARFARAFGVPGTTIVALKAAYDEMVRMGSK